MSLFKSILPGRTLTRNEYSLPVYNVEPEIFPPPPVTASYYAPAGVERETSTHEDLPRSDALAIIQRKDKYLRRKLQELLDAQGDGLMNTFQETSQNEADEESLNTPTQTSFSIRSHSVSPSPLARPKRRIGLKAARRGIGKAIVQFADLKVEEDAVLREDLQNDQDILQQLLLWEKKEAGLKSKIASIEHVDADSEAQNLKDEVSRLESEIQDTEIRLAQMKTRHRTLIRELSDRENSVSSRLSSYKASLSLLERDIKEFLESPPKHDERVVAKTPFFSLPANRRNLEMAKEHWEKDVNAIKGQRKAARRERLAYEEGAHIWQQVVNEITGFERFLQLELDTMNETFQQQPLAVKNKGKSKARTPTDILERMDMLGALLEEKLDFAVKKEWRLLQICIQQELAGLDEGVKLLKETFQITEDVDSTTQLTADHAADSEPELEDPSVQSSTRDLFASAAEGLTSKTLSHSDDEPDPELLFSTREDDTD